jgi:hypothetical protein
MKKAVFSTPDADDMLRCLDRLKLAMPCDMTEVKHGDVWQPADRNPDTGYLNANYAQYTPNLVQDVGYSLSGAGLGQFLLQLDANNTANGSSANATAAAPPPTRGLPALLAAADNRSAAVPPPAAATSWAARDALRQFIVEVDAMQRARRRAETRRRAEGRRAAAARALQPAAAASPRVEPSTANATRGTGLVCLAPVCRGFM